MNFCGLCDIPLWIILTVWCLVSLYIYGSSSHRLWQKLGVPSPPAMLFLGHMNELFNPKTGYRGCIGKWTQRYGKIFGILFFHEPFLVVSDLETLKEVFVKDFNNYTDRHAMQGDYVWTPLVLKGLFFNEGDDWKRIRRLMTPSFSSGKLKHLTRYINMTSRNLVDTFHKHAESGTNPDAKTVFSAYSLDALVGPAFGLELNSQEDVNGAFYQHARGLMSVTDRMKILLVLLGSFPFLARLSQMLGISYLGISGSAFFKKHLTKLIEERKSNPEGQERVDFLQFLINAEAESSENLFGSKTLTAEEIVGQGIMFMIAGYETTSTTLQWLSYELAKNKDVQKRMKEEIDEVVDGGEVTYEQCQKLRYTDAVINETLRMYPPIVQVARRAKESRVLKGHTVPAGCGILCPIYTVGRDPDLFDDPDTFNPGRFMDDLNSPLNSISFLPFGFGPRQCIGQRLAYIQLKIALVHLLRNVTIEDTIPRNVEVNDFTGLMSPKEPIKLIVKKCQKQA